MTRQVLKILSVLSSFLFFARCAQQAPLTGGARDQTPPKFISSVPAGKTSNFNSDLIVLQFNEYVQVKDLANQLIVSPKLKTTPEVEADRRSIKIHLAQKELQPNTTYRIYFGQAIADMNEGNVLKDFEFVFSTGPYIDSLTVTGVVTDAFNNKPADGILMGLYLPSEKADSLPYLEPPAYISRSDNNGHFTFGNLPYATFRAYAISDKNKNLVYDGETEKIAFLDSALVLKSDSLNINLHLFQEESPRGFIKKTVTPYYGLAQIVLNKKAKTVVMPLDTTDRDYIFETRANVEKDTIALYYRGIQDTLGIILHHQNRKSDTLHIVLPKKGKVSGTHFKSIIFNTVGSNLPLNTPLTVSFLNWMDTTLTTKARLRLKSKEDSLINDDRVTGYWRDLTTFEITNPLQEGSNYTLSIDTSAFVDINGLTSDSSKVSFKTQSRNEFGKVTLQLLLNKKQPYCIQLVNAKEQVVKEQFVSFALSSSNAASLVFTNVVPDTYLVKIIFDDNGNKKWDSGNLLLKKQPERVIINSKQVKVLADWEIEEEISVKE